MLTHCQTSLQMHAKKRASDASAARRASSAVQEVTVQKDHMMDWDDDEVAGVRMTIL